MDENGSNPLSIIRPTSLAGYSGFPHPGEPCLRNRLVAACLPPRQIGRRLRLVRRLLDIAAGLHRVVAWIGEEEWWDMTLALGEQIRILPSTRSPSDSWGFRRRREIYRRVWRWTCTRPPFFPLAFEPLVSFPLAFGRPCSSRSLRMSWRMFYPGLPDA